MAHRTCSKTSCLGQRVGHLAQFVSVVLLLFCLRGSEADAQRLTTRPRDTPSHRHLPLKAGQSTPKLKDFQSPELNELVRQYSTMRRQQRLEERRIQQELHPGESTRERIARQKQLTEQLNRNMPLPRTNDISQEIKSASEELGRRLGGALAESMKTGSIPFDPNEAREYWDQTSQLAETIRMEKAKANEQYQKALAAYKESWPADAVAPEEWMTKVQPFINSEVVEQLAEASRQFEAQKHLPPEERKFTGFSDGSPLIDETRGKGTGMIDSLMTSLDKQSVEWLKSASKDKKSGSFWKSLGRGAKSGLASLNQKMTDDSVSKVATRKPLDQLRQQGSSPLFAPNAASTGPTPLVGASSTAASGSSNSTSQSDNIGFPWWGLFALMAIVAPIVFFLRRNAITESTDEGNALICADAIHDRASLLAACHQLAIRKFGLRSCFWNHRKLFRKLMERIDGRNQILEQLSQLYERARSAPEQRLTELEIERARKLFKQVRGVAGHRR